MTDALDLAELKRLLATDSEINTLNRFYSSGQYSASEEAIFDAAAKELFELRRLSGALIARLEQAEAALSEAQAERDEAINWSAIVEQHGTDKFDDLAGQWFAQEAVARMHRALSSVFIKYANTELMDRFNGQMRVITLQAFVEGALCGVRASKTEAQTELEAARGKCAQAAKWFREYEAQHAAKGTVDGEQKAMRNAYRAMVLEGAIEPPSAALSAPKAEGEG